MHATAGWETHRCRPDLQSVVRQQLRHLSQQARCLGPSNLPGATKSRVGQSHQSGHCQHAARGMGMHRTAMHMQDVPAACTACCQQVGLTWNTVCTSTGSPAGSTHTHTYSMTDCRMAYMQANMRAVHTQVCTHITTSLHHLLDSHAAKWQAAGLERCGALGAPPSPCMCVGALSCSPPCSPTPLSPCVPTCALRQCQDLLDGRNLLGVCDPA